MAARYGSEKMLIFQAFSYRATALAAASGMHYWVGP